MIATVDTAKIVAATASTDTATKHFAAVVAVECYCATSAPTYKTLVSYLYLSAILTAIYIHTSLSRSTAQLRSLALLTTLAILRNPFTQHSIKFALFAKHCVHSELQAASTASTCS
jgi:hypothetical protein